MDELFVGEYFTRTWIEFSHENLIGFDFWLHKSLIKNQFEPIRNNWWVFKVSIAVIFGILELYNFSFYHARLHANFEARTWKKLKKITNRPKYSGAQKLRTEIASIIHKCPLIHLKSINLNKKIFLFHLFLPSITYTFPNRFALFLKYPENCETFLMNRKIAPFKIISHSIHKRIQFWGKIDSWQKYLGRDSLQISLNIKYKFRQLIKSACKSFQLLHKMNLNFYWVNYKTVYFKFNGPSNWKAILF